MFVTFVQFCLGYSQNRAHTVMVWFSELQLNNHGTICKKISCQIFLIAVMKTNSLVWSKMPKTSLFSA